MLRDQGTRWLNMFLRLNLGQVHPYPLLRWQVEATEWQEQRKDQGWILDINTSRIEPFSGLMSPEARVLVYNVITNRVESNTSGGAEFRTHKEGFQLSLPGPKRPNSANSIHAKPRKRSTLSWFGFSKQRTDHWGNQKIPSWSPAEMVGQLKMAPGLTLYHCVLNRKHPLVCREKVFWCFGLPQDMEPDLQDRARNPSW